jgi:outer membrane protein assembly factor BamB
MLRMVLGVAVTAALTVSVAAQEGAGRLVALAGIDRGLCSVIECSEPALPLALAQDPGFVVHALSRSAGVIDRVKARASAEGLYGKRLVAEVLPPAPLPYAEGSVDLLLWTSADETTLGELPSEEVARVLRPGGVAIVGARSGLAAAPLRRWARTEVVEASGAWAKLVRPPSPLADEWTHWQHAPDNNPVSTDALIKAPYMTQFLSLPYFSPMPSISVICNGLQFRATGHMAIHEREERFLNTLFATSAHNGLILWTRPLPEGYLVHRSLFVATSEVLYLLEPQRCLLLDPRTGEERGEISLPAGAEEGAQWQWIALEDGVLYGLIGKDTLPAEIIERKRATGAWGWNELSQGYYETQYPWGYGRLLVALDPATQRELWRHEEATPIDSRALCMKAGRLFLHGEGAFVAALDTKTGNALWRNEDPALLAAIAEANDAGLGFKTTPYTLCTEEMLFLAGRGRLNVVGLRAADGARAWTVPGAYNATNMLYTGNQLIAHIPVATRIEPLTGALAGELGIQKRSCARFTGCPEALFHRGSLNVGEGSTRYDLSTGQAGVIHAFRPPCNDGIIPAEGRLHITQWDCDCNLQLMGGIALTSVGDFELGRAATDAERLQTFPAAREPQPLTVSPTDWPTYRADNARSQSSAARAPEAISGRWESRPPTSWQPSAPTAAGGLVFVAGDDGRVRALDAATGAERWAYATAGPVRLPPSLWEGRAYVGSGDGYVTCLQAATGRPLWRFRAAPIERRIMVYGALSSTWPVNTGVLVEDGVAYAGAGIISYDGTHVYALDARTGTLRWQNNTSGHLNPQLRAGVSIQGDAALIDGRLMLAGGNVASPAVFDLADGTCLNQPPGPRPPHAHRGSEIGAFVGGALMLGGQRLYTDPTDPITTNQGVDLLGPGVAPGKHLPGRVPPAVGNGVVVMAAQGPLVCADAEAIADWLTVQDKQARFKPRWVVESVQSAVATAISANAVLAAGREQVAEGQPTRWVAAAFDLASGRELWRESLPSAPLPGGLCLEAGGRVIVVLEDGGVIGLH